MLGILREVQLSRFPAIHGSHRVIRPRGELRGVERAKPQPITIAGDLSGVATRVTASNTTKPGQGRAARRHPPEQVSFDNGLDIKFNFDKFKTK
jgi:hypothetical protein